MLKIFPIFILIIIILSACTQKDSEKEISSKEEDLFIFRASNGFDIFYDPAEKNTIKSYFESGTVVLNGSYFGMSPWPDGRWRGAGMSIPAGLWIEKGIQKYPLRTDDPNLSHVVFVSGSIVTIQENHQSESGMSSCLSMTNCRAFQAGPLVLSENALQNFPNSWHANEPHERTLIGVTKKRSIYFFVSTDKLSLSEVGQKVIELPEFRDDPITLLNLDGGPSTAYYDGSNGFHEDTKLPIILRINP